MDNLTRRLLCLSICCFLFFPYYSIETATSKQFFPDHSPSVISHHDYFTENKGQWNPEILFMGSTSFGRIAFTAHSIVYEIQSPLSTSHLDLQTQQSIPLSFQSQFVQITFPTSSYAESKSNVSLLPLHPLNHVNHYLKGPSEKWATHCQNYTSIQYNDIWEEIDLCYYYSSEGLKYEFYVHPDGNYEDIQMKVEGATLEASQYQLQIHTNIGTLFDDQLYVYLKDSGTKVPAEFMRKGTSTYGFHVTLDKDIQEASRTETIVIDPVVFSTFLGGYKLDNCSAIQVDSSDHSYIAGFTRSTTADYFPIGNDIPGFDTTANGDYDVFLMKVDPTGSNLLYSTYIGGSNYDVCTDIALNSSDHICLVGNTLSTPSEGFPIGDDIPGFCTEFNGHYEGFLVMISEDGSSLLYSSYVGGASNDYTTCIKTDDNDCIYIGGNVSSSPNSFPIGGDIPGFQTDYKGNDGYVMKLDPSGTKILFSTYIGGTNGEEINDIALDRENNIYITGYTDSKEGESFPIEPALPGFDKKHNDLHDAFVIKLDSSGTQLLYSTYVGGEKDDVGTAIIVDQNNNAYVTGYTFSDERTFPVSVNVPGFDKIHGGYEDVFCIKINPQGNQLLFSTYIGGVSYDTSREIVLGEDNTIFISGDTRSDDGSFPVGGKYPGLYYIFGGNIDSFIVQLDSMGKTILFSSLLGGQMLEENTYVDLSSSGDIFVAGQSSSSERDDPPFPICPDLPGFSKRNRGGNGDIYLIRITLTEQPPNDPKPTLGFQLPVNKITLRTNQKKDVTLTLTNIGEENSILEGNLSTFFRQKDVIPWLTMDHTVFSIPHQDSFDVKVQFDSSQLLAGLYEGSILITSNDTVVPEAQIDVSLEVIAYNPSIHWSFNKNSFDLNPDEKIYETLRIENTGEKNSVLEGTISTDKPWLKVEKESFSIPSSLSLQTSIEIDTHKMNPGKFTGNIFIHSNDPSSEFIKIPLTLMIQLPQPVLLCHRRTIEEEMVQGTSKQTILTIENQGPNHSMLHIEISSKLPWIQLHPCSSSLASQQKETFQITIDTNTLPPNETYKGVITILSNDPQSTTLQIPMSVKILPIELLISLQIGNSTVRIQTTDGKRNERMLLDAPPSIINGRTVVPLRFLAETFGAKVEWYAKEEEIQLRFDNMLIHLWLHRTYGRTYDALIERVQQAPAKVRLETPPCIINGRTMVPLRFIGETFGAKVDWDGVTQTITLTKSL
ncbi:MAG: stalk domain-containing protein [Caldisericia bacterium]|nr:stalk domain-containing protein [Caldisericia bacterium]